MRPPVASDFSTQQPLKRDTDWSCLQCKSGDSRGIHQPSPVTCSREDTQVCPGGPSQLKHVKGGKHRSLLSDEESVSPWQQSSASSLAEHSWHSQGLVHLVLEPPCVSSTKKVAVCLQLQTTDVWALSLIGEDSISTVLDRARGTRQARGRFHPEIMLPSYFIGQDGCTLCRLYGGGPRGFWIIAVSSVSLWGRLGFSFWRFILEFNQPPSPKILWPTHYPLHKPLYSTAVTCGPRVVTDWGDVRL